MYLLLIKNDYGWNITEFKTIKELENKIKEGFIYDEFKVAKELDVVIVEKEDEED